MGYPLFFLNDLGCVDHFNKISCPILVVQSIPMNLLGRKSCSAEASTIFEFHLHCTKDELVHDILLKWSLKAIGIKK